ncbi:MAG: TonB-dependent receptor [Bacteroidales bacterium]|nr:TonB-dependent receptor [Bacteroidales bacterium]
MNCKHKAFYLFFMIFFALTDLYSQNFTISGQIKDGETGEDLIGATIIIENESGVGATTNVYGFYSLTLPSGDYSLVYSFIGFKDQKFKIHLDKNIIKNIELATNASKIDEVVVSAEKSNKNVVSNQMSVAKLDLKEAEALPVLFGERDIMKTIQLMPGVQTAGEGSSGFYVRGGSADQNLILLDGAPVYNASHLLGFFSVFNSDALKDVQLYKGSIPAEFGGRLSSVMDIKMKEGNSKQLSVSGGIGLIASKLTIEAPIVKDKGSFIISGRRTYADLFLKLSKNEAQKNSSLYFYDLNLKANYKIGENDRIYLSGYFGQDHFGFNNVFGFDWGNKTATLRWNHIASEKLFSNTSLIYSDYSYLIDIQVADFKIGSKINDINLKQDFDYFLNRKMKLKFGGNIIHHTFDPGFLDAQESSGINNIDVQNKYSIESALYLSNEHQITSLLTLTYGLRYSNFTQIGPGDIYTYNADGEVKDTTVYNDWEAVSSYNAWSPRLGLKYILSENSSVKASYSRTNQFLHLMSNSTSGTPLDVWLPSSNNIKPEIADQWALGYFRNFKSDMYEFSLEAYYKNMQNVIDFRPGADINLNPTIEGDLIYGKGRSYGLEFFLKKAKGRFTGWISYTLAKSERQIESINKGAWYSAKQDRIHDLSLVAMFKITERLDVSAVWIYYTGNAVTFPSGKYEIDGQFVNYYTERNGYRMPDYHRLDLSINLKNKKKDFYDKEKGIVVKPKHVFESSWSFSVYNAYMRENAYSISFRQNENDPSKTEAVQLALFKIIPSISYNFKF